MPTDPLIPAGRLPGAFTTPGSSSFVDFLAQHAPDLPPPATAEADAQVVLHWPDHYTAVALPDTPRGLQSAWEDRGYTFIRFPTDTAAWPPLFQRIGRLLSP